MLLRVDGAGGPRNFILQPGAMPLVAGRGTDTDIRLPDALRSISRRHLSFQLEGQGSGTAVRVVVVSEALGAWSSRGELPPGSSCLLAAGEHLVIGEYRISVLASAPDGPEPIPAPVEPPQPTTPPPRPRTEPALAAPAVPQPGPTAPTDDAMDLLGLIMPKEAPGAPIPHSGLDGQAFQVLPMAPPPAPRWVAPAQDPSPSAPGAAARGAVARAAGDSAQDVSPQDAVLGFLAGSAPPGRAAGNAEADTEPPAPLLVRMVPPDPLEWMAPVTPPAAPSSAAEPAAPDAADDLWSQLSHLAASVQGAPVPSLDTSVAQDRLPTPAPTAATALPPAAPSAIAPAATPVGPADSRAHTPPLDRTVDEAEACRALAQGLGIELPPTLSAADWQHIGATLRALVEGYASLLHARDSVRSTLGVPGRTEMFSHDNNPLKLRVTPPVRLKLMALPQPDERRHLPAPRAIAEATQDLQDHNMAIIAACRVAMEELVHSFDPQRWETAEAAGKRLPILGEAQLWRRYREHYQQQTQHMADLIQRLFEQHFMNAYARGLDRPRGPGGAGGPSATGAPLKG